MPRLHRIGWILFVVSSVLFAIAGIRARDPWVVAGSAAFGIACMLFLVTPEG